jgi:hypothetical protein
MSQLQIYEQKDFTGGLNFRADQFQLSDNESPKMLNVEIDPRGGVFSRGGYERINGTAVAGTWSPKRLHKFTGATNRIMLTTGAKVYQSTGGNFTPLAYSLGNDIAVSYAYGASFANWGTDLYIATGGAGAGSYSWVTTSTYATAISVLTTSHFNNNYNSPNATYFPKANLLMVHANKMFAAGVNISGVDYPNRLRWSHEDSPKDWASADYIDIVGGGNGITGLAVVNGSLMIFKPNAIYLLLGYDSDDFRLVQLSGHLGAPHPLAVSLSDSSVYFFSNPEGLYSFDGSRLVDLFANIRPATDANEFNLSAPNAVTLSWVGHRLWMSAPYSKDTTVTDPKVNFVFDPSIGQGGSFTMFQSSDGYGLVGGCDYEDSSNNNIYLMIHPTQPRVLQVDKYSLDSDNITGTPASFVSYYRTKWFDGGSYMQKKMFRRPDIVTKEPSTSTVINVKVYHNFEEGAGNERKNFDLTLTPTSTGIIWGTGLWGGLWGSGAASSTVLTGRNLGLARCVQLEFTGPSGQFWGINSIGYKYQGRRVKG